MTQKRITVEDLINESTDLAKMIMNDITYTEVRRNMVRETLRRHIQNIKAAYAMPDVEMAAPFCNVTVTGLDEIPFSVAFPAEFA